MGVKAYTNGKGPGNGFSRRAGMRRLAARCSCFTATHFVLLTVMNYKQPRSIQVVVFDNNGTHREFLLLHRVASHGGFWQSVTGSLEGGESHAQAAIRELREETGFELSEDRLVDLNLVNRFEIAPQWRPFYAPGVTHNDEVCFAASVSAREVRLDVREHDAYIWADYAKALALLYWKSSRLALAAAAGLSTPSPGGEG